MPGCCERSKSKLLCTFVAAQVQLFHPGGDEAEVDVERGVSTGAGLFFYVCGWWKRCAAYVRSPSAHPHCKDSGVGV